MLLSSIGKLMIGHKWMFYNSDSQHFFVIWRSIAILMMKFWPMQIYEYVLALAHKNLALHRWINRAECQSFQFLFWQLDWSFWKCSYDNRTKKLFSKTSMQGTWRVKALNLLKMQIVSFFLFRRGYSMFWPSVQDHRKPPTKGKNIQIQRIRHLVCQTMTVLKK